MLADEFDRDPMTIWHILQEAGKNYLKSKWVPHELTMPQQTKRFNACVQLLERHSEDRLDLRDIVTCDEKWIAFDNPHRHNEWRSYGQEASSTPVKDFRKEKRMLVVFWCFAGIIHWELLKKGQTMTAELYCKILDRVRQRLQNRSTPIILLHDNARPHTANATKNWLRGANWEVLEHPPYSPDLAPSDYHLFRSMEHFLRGKKFQNVAEIEQNLQNFFNSKDREFYRRGIFMLPDMWFNCIDSDGDYFDY
jgi:histone-lysine N-methyltransferase SETMAR